MAPKKAVAKDDKTKTKDAKARGPVPPLHAPEGWEWHKVAMSSQGKKMVTATSLVGHWELWWKNDDEHAQMYM